MSKKTYTLKQDLLYGGTLFIASSIGIAFFLFIYELIERIKCTTWIESWLRTKKTERHNVTSALSIVMTVGLVPAATNVRRRLAYAMKMTI